MAVAGVHRCHLPAKHDVEFNTGPSLQIWAVSVVTTAPVKEYSSMCWQTVEKLQRAGTERVLRTGAAAAQILRWCRMCAALASACTLECADVLQVSLLTCSTDSTLARASHAGGWLSVLPSAGRVEGTRTLGAVGLWCAGHMEHALCMLCEWATLMQRDAAVLHGF
jgi:hypothetical protein